MRARRALVAGVAAALVCASGGRASAEGQVTVGLYAPTAPFKGPSERLEYISSLASHLAGAAGDRKVVGRVFARASAFASAVKSGEIQYAVVDAPYAVMSGLSYEVLAAATRDGRAEVPWMLVASGSVRGIADLRGEVVAMPRIGARARAFLANSLLEGEVNAGYFGKVTSAPDTFSALTLVSVGRARAAFVPSGVSLPSDVRRVLTLRSVGWPMFVALPRADRKLTAAFRARAGSFSGRVLSGFAGARAGNYGALRASFGKRQRRGIMAVPKPSRLAVERLFGGRVSCIEMSDIASLVTTPAVARRK
jgi:hypothetical protein